MRMIRNYLVEVKEYEYLYEEKQHLLEYFDQKYGENWTIKRSGPKIIEPGRLHKTLHYMVLHIKR